MSKEKGWRVSGYQNKKYQKRYPGKKHRGRRKNQDCLEYRKHLRGYSDHEVNFNKHDTGQEVSHNKTAQKCSAAKSVEEFVERINKVGDRLNIHHIYPQSRIGASWEITRRGLITNEWNELRALERKHVCLNVLFEVVIKIQSVTTATISRTPQEICKQIELWGNASGKINFGDLSAVQLVAWSELFGRIENVKDAIDLIKKDWDIQPKWQNICQELSLLKVRKCGQYWFVRNHELKLAVATVSARYRKEIDH